jgi:Domain of unknown function (DUF4129)
MKITNYGWSTRRPIGRLTPLPIPFRVGVVAGLAVLLAMAAAGSRARVGRGPSVGSTAVRLGFDALEFLAVVALLGGLALLVVGFPRMRRRRPDDEPEWVVERPPIPWYAKLLMLGLVLIVLAGLAGSLLVVRHQFEERQVAPPVPTGPTSPPAPSSIPPAGGNPPAAGEPLSPVVWAVVVVVVTAAGWAAALWVRTRGRVALPDDRRALEEPVIEEALRLSLEDLRGEPDPRRAIVAAYARMLAALGRLGVGRRAAEAPLEYLRRVLGALEGDPEPTRWLTDLFERAEFSRQPVTEAMRAEAIDALEAVRARLGSAA